jgi:hypothetical protein
MMYFSLKALYLYPCDFFFDTEGYPFTFIIVKLLLPNCKIGTYIHYPFIKEEMINKDTTNEISSKL